MNENLRYALLKARLQVTDVAAALTVDPKTVDRWLNGRIPYPRHRWAVAELLGTDEDALWPQLAQRRGAISGQIRATYAHRWTVPQAIWTRLFRSAAQEIGILTYSALFLAEDTGIMHALAGQAAGGVRVRILLGDPDSPQIQARGEEENIGPDVMAARVRNALTLFGPLATVSGVEIRLHGTVLYNSIYMADDELMVNHHVYGTSAPQSPVLHLTANDHDGPAAVYLASFERVWTAAQPYTSAT